MQELIREITQKLPETVVKEHEPLARYTSFKIGGPAELLLLPQTASDIPPLLAILNRCGVPLHILGGGTNLLIPDQGVSGVVLWCLALKWL